MTDHKNKNGKKKAALALLLLFLFGSVTTYTAVRFLNPAKDSNIIASDSTLQAPQDITDESVPLAAPQVTENETEDTLVSTLPSQTMEPETQPPVSEILSSAPVQQITSHTQNNDNNDVPPADNEQNNNNNDSNSVVWNEETILAKAREMMETISTMTAAEKQEYFGIKNNNFSNDTFRDKLLSFIGEGWPTIDSQILAETQNLQNSTLYISCYFAGNKTPILFGSLYNDNTKNWNTNMIYVNGTWYEYVEKTPWGKIKGFKMTSLKSQADVEALTEMLTSIEEANGIWNPINVK